MIISGNFSFYSEGGDLYDNRDGERNTVIEIDPAASYFVISGLALGLKLQYSHEIQGDRGWMSWGLGPELNYYFGRNNGVSDVKGDTYPFLQGGFYYSNLTYDYVLGEDLTRVYTTTRVGVGIAHMISNFVALSSLLAYDIDTMKHENEDSVAGNRVGIYVGFLIFLY